MPSADSSSTSTSYRVRYNRTRTFSSCLYIDIDVNIRTVFILLLVFTLSLYFWPEWYTSIAHDFAAFREQTKKMRQAESLRETNSGVADDKS